VVFARMEDRAGVAFRWVAVDGIRAVEVAVAVDLVDLAAEVLAAVVQGGRGNGIIFRFAFLNSG